MFAPNLEKKKSSSNMMAVGHNPPQKWGGQYEKELKGYGGTRGGDKTPFFNGTQTTRITLKTSSIK